VISWREMSLGCLRGAKRLLDDDNFRSSVSRAYYTAYCAATSALAVRGVTFAHGWHNPGHEQLPGLILNNSTLPRPRRWRVNRALRLLRQAREDADYRPDVTVDRPLALACVHHATMVLDLLEIYDV
jgi:HEPN domain